MWLYSYIKLGFSVQNLFGNAECVCVPLYWEDARLFFDLACSAARKRCAVHNYQASEQNTLGHFDLTLVWRDWEKDTALILTHPSPARLCWSAQGKQRLTMQSVSPSEQPVRPGAQAPLKRANAAVLNWGCSRGGGTTKERCTGSLKESLDSAKSRTGVHSPKTPLNIHHLRADSV